jgi:hypothetical protein
MSVDYTSVEFIVKKYLTVYASRAIEDIIFTFDRYYTPIGGNEALTLLQNDEDLSDLLKKDEVYDCDDYSLMARAKAGLTALHQKLDKAYCIGVLYTTQHVTNFSIGEDERFYLVDFMFKKTCSENYSDFLLEEIGSRWLKQKSMHLIII